MSPLLSPREVIQSARQQVMASTITEGLSVRGARKEGWENPDSGAANRMHCRDHSLTVQNILDNILRKQAFGIDDYNPKAVVKDLLPVHTHVRAK